MRARVLLPCVAAVLTACTRLPSTPPGTTLPAFSIRPVDSATPSPFVQIQSGSVRAIVPGSWQAAPLPTNRFPQEGFIASPRLADWDEATGTVRGMEAFWVDIGAEGIPSDYYYLAARSDELASLAGQKGCHADTSKVILDRPPDLSGQRFSPSDYVASATGTCHVAGAATRWAYVVAAPGYGPIRQVGIPTSGLYVVIAVVVSGPQSKAMLQEMIDGAQFGSTSISQIVQTASGIPS
ncbi:MAG: hypothetical protein E6G47_01895 [Actinobacteria bacterium]|nr:MAG: hypothetical protein E6G47_01895 [Actinomycetota bacterium]